MKKVVLRYGLMSGVMIAVLMVATIPFEDRIGLDHAMYVGYATMVVAFLMVFFGVRRYRDEVCGGEITFARALGVGALIMLMTCVFYVVTWEVMYFGFMPDFMDKYCAHVIEKARAAGATAAEMQAKMAEVNRAKAMYSHVWSNALVTFLEPLPVGLVMALGSAAVLRRRRVEVTAEAG